MLIEVSKGNLFTSEQCAHRLYVSYRTIFTGIVSKLTTLTTI